MGKIADEIDLLRLSIRQVTDDSKFSDEELYGRWNAARVDVIEKEKERLEDRRDARRLYNFNTEFDKERFCFELEWGKSHDCGCISLGCDVLVSKYQLPKPLGRMEVTTLSGQTIGYSTENEFRSLRHDPILSSQPRYGTYSNRIFIYNPGSLGLNLKVLQANAVWQDPAAWAGLQYCNEITDGDGNTTVDCKDAKDINSGLNLRYSLRVRQMVMQELGFTLQIPDDKHADYADK